MSLATQLEKLSNRFNTILESSDNPSFWAIDRLGIDLFDNQVEIVDAVCDLSIKYLAIAESRGAGKTFGVGLGLVKICLDNPGIQIGVFGPKAEQANRVVSEIKSRILISSSSAYETINWKTSTNSKLEFLNGSLILSISASEATMQEGWHFDCVVIDEAHRVSDISVNQRIIPMLGSSRIAKIIKLGVSMYRQNFWKSCCHPSTQYKVLIRDWTQCPILLRQGSVIYKGKELSKYVIDQMPLTLKEKYFPDRPDLHYDGAMSEVDFKTQYGMEWLQDINLELGEDDQKKLIDSTYDILEKGRLELQDQYFFGLDTASGSILPGQKDLDFTVLSLWRKRADNIKEKVACFQWQGDVLQQISEIEQIIHPETGFFHCVFGLADYSNIAIGVVESFKAKKIPIEGIMFSSTEPSSKKNYKNAMFDQFKFELQSGRVKFPSLEKLDTHVIFKKSFNEWCNIERHKSLGINDKIQAPSDMHDDHTSADVLCVWGMDKLSTFKTVASSSTYKIPSPVTDIARVLGRGINTQQPKSKYLPGQQTYE